MQVSERISKIRPPLIVRQKNIVKDDVIVQQSLDDFDLDPDPISHTFQQKPNINLLMPANIGFDGKTAIERFVRTVATSPCRQSLNSTELKEILKTQTSPVSVTQLS